MGRKGRRIKMEFRKELVYTALNADELKPGDKVIVAFDIKDLKEEVHYNEIPNSFTLEKILPEYKERRFIVKERGAAYAVAYLVEKAENCTNCGAECDNAGDTFEGFKIETCDNWQPKTAEKNCENCSRRQWCKTRQHRVDFQMSVDDYACEEWKPKNTEKNCEDCSRCSKEGDDLICAKDGRKIYQPYLAKNCSGWAERKHYRPFRDTDELIKVWSNKCPAHNHRDRGLTMPLIWVRDKDNDVGQAQHLITDFNVTRLNEDNDGYVTGITVNCIDTTFDDLLEYFTFLDGSPCGVEE